LLDQQKAGKIRYIGVTNFDALHLNEILDAGIPVISNQVQYSVFDHRPQGDLQRLAKEYNLFILCYGTVAGGFLNERYLDIQEFKDPLENRSLVKYRLIIEEFGGMDLFRSILRVLEKIANKYNVNIADVATQYILQKPHVAGVIIGARNTNHLENLKSLRNLILDDEDIQDIHGVTGQSTGPTGPVYGLERDRSGRHGEIMKYNLNKQ
jgi:aryl-alcohol dehydrogenase-like predicted oxidoreductase